MWKLGIVSCLFWANFWAEYSSNAPQGTWECPQQDSLWLCWGQGGALLRMLLSFLLFFVTSSTSLVLCCLILFCFCLSRQGSRPSNIPQELFRNAEVQMPPPERAELECACWQGDFTRTLNSHIHLLCWDRCRFLLPGEAFSGFYSCCFVLLSFLWRPDCYMLFHTFQFILLLPL